MSNTRILRTRTTIAGVVALALTGTIACGAFHANGSTVSQSPPPNGSVELTWAPTYMSNDGNYTASEAISMAQRFNLIAAQPNSFQSYAAAMKKANPHLSLLTYANANFLPPSAAASMPASYFAHDIHGNKIKSLGFGTYMMNGASAGWRATAASQCQQKAAAAHYDGCLIDMLTMGIYSKGFVSAIPVVPGTNTVYSQDAYRSMLISEAKTYDANDPHDIIVGNSVSNAGRYYGPVSSAPIVQALPGAQEEDFLRGAADPASKFPTAASWLQNVHIIQAIESSGHTGLFSTKLWVGATRSVVAQWQSYAMATFLMGANGHSFFAFTDSRTKVGAMETDLPYTMPKSLGNPSGAMQASGSVYVRNFANGKVVVNPGTSTVSVSLGGSYTALGGNTVTTASLPAHSGGVYLKK